MDSLELLGIFSYLLLSDESNEQSAFALTSKGDTLITRLSKINRLMLMKSK